MSQPLKNNGSLKPTEVGAPPVESPTPKPVRNRRRLSGPPYNPVLQQLVDGKQAWADPLDERAEKQGFLGWHQRGYLPHRDAPGLTQFVTFRLHDSLPVSCRAEWEALLRIEDDRQRRNRLEEYLDLGHGECWLRRPEIAALTESIFREHDARYYDLLAWVVMPNHVHVLVQVRETPLSSLAKGWKGRIAREANMLLGRQGAFWQRDCWDTYMRNEEHVMNARRYIEQNPVKAKLVRETKEWPWGSARFRDEYGRLERRIYSA